METEVNDTTNRDKFNAMNNATLAEILCRNKEYSICDFCSYIDDLMSNYSCHQSCFEGVKTWLDAPCKENPPADKHVDLQKVSGKVCDNVNHPDHYNHGKIEVIDFIEDQHLGFHLGNAVKYISRAGRKNSDKTVEDLRKAVWYINRQIERLEGGLEGVMKIEK